MEYPAYLLGSPYGLALQITEFDQIACSFFAYFCAHNLDKTLTFTPEMISQWLNKPPCAKYFSAWAFPSKL
jgi:hypothetical protein